LTNTLFRLEEAPDLKGFFARLHECRDKNAHVHGLHPYPAKFIPHIPRALLAALAKPGDVVLDPMCGSGTTLVEATLAGHPAVGVDLNPIATLVSRAKTAPLSAGDRCALHGLAAQFERASMDLRLSVKGAFRPQPRELPRFHNRDKWFQRGVTHELAAARAAIQELASGSARDLAFCALSSIIVGVSNQESETRWCAKPRAVAPGETFKKVATRLSDALSRVRSYEEERRATAVVYTADARDLPLDDASVGLVVTSPPYANSHDYYLYNKLRMFWLGYDVASVQQSEIGSRNRHSDLKEDIGTYSSAMGGVLSECRRVIRPGGFIAIVVADAVIRGEFFNMADIYSDLARASSFQVHSSYQFGHREFNKSFQRGFGTARNKQTHVLILQAARG
jgi:site-specific DNA-methyltransferase (cytosine-N4-specific)